jgi:hypothetical protein
MSDTHTLSKKEISNLIESANIDVITELARSSRYSCYGCKRKNCTMSMPYGGCDMKTLHEEKHSDKPALIDRKHKVKHFRKRRYNTYR